MNYTTSAIYIGKRRNIVLAIVLTLITLGIYSIYWFFSLGNDLGKAKPDSGCSGLKDFLLTLITLGIYGLYLHYKYPRVTADIQRERNLPVYDFATLSLVLAILGLGIIPLCMIQNEINKIWEATPQPLVKPIKP